VLCLLVNIHVDVGLNSKQVSQFFSASKSLTNKSVQGAAKNSQKEVATTVHVGR